MRIYARATTSNNVYLGAGGKFGRASGRVVAEDLCLNGESIGSCPLIVFWWALSWGRVDPVARPPEPARAGGLARNHRQPSAKSLHKVTNANLCGAHIVV